MPGADSTVSQACRYQNREIIVAGGERNKAVSGGPTATKRPFWYSITNLQENGLKVEVTMIQLKVSP